MLEKHVKISGRVVEEKVLKGERGRVIFIWPPEHHPPKLRLVTLQGSVVATIFVFGVLFIRFSWVSE